MNQFFNLFEGGKGRCLLKIKFELIPKLRSTKGYCVLPIFSFPQWQRKISFSSLTFRVEFLTRKEMHVHGSINLLSKALKTVLFHNFRAFTRDTMPFSKCAGWCSDVKIYRRFQYLPVKNASFSCEYEAYPSSKSTVVFNICQ